MSTMPINFKNAVRYVLLFLDLPGVDGVTRNSYPNCYATWEGIHLHIYEWGTDILRASYHQKNVLLMENHGDADGEPADTGAPAQQARPRAAVAPPLPPAGTFPDEDPQLTQMLPRIDVTDPSNLREAGRPDLAEREEMIRHHAENVALVNAHENPVHQTRQERSPDFQQTWSTGSIPRTRPVNTPQELTSDDRKVLALQTADAITQTWEKFDEPNPDDDEKFQKFQSGNTRTVIRHRKAPLMERLSRKSKKQAKKARVQVNRCMVPAVLALSVYMGHGGSLVAG